jgi:hypothetical protein
VNDEENKLKEAFELSDLLHSKRKEEIIEGLEEKLSEISEEFVKTNTFYGSQHIRYLLKERIKRIREIVRSRLNINLSSIEKAMIPFSDDIYQEISKRVSDVIESEIEFAKNKMLHFCRNSPYPINILKIMNRILDNEKNILIENVERDILIHKMKSELEVKKNIKKPKIFLSYSHKNKDIADRVDKFFISKNIRLTRDVRDVPAYSSLTKFMDTIRDHDYVIMLISNAYLKSTNCMYEVIQFIQERNYIGRTFPIIIDNEATIFDHSKHGKYIRYWQIKYKEFGDEIKTLQYTGTSPLHKELDKINKIQSNIGEFLNKIADLKCFSLDELESTNYKAILDKIGKTLVVFQKEEIEVESEKLKARIIGCLYKWYIEGLEQGKIPVFNVKEKINEWKVSSKLMNKSIDEMVDDGYLEWSTFGRVKLKKEGKLLARKEKLEHKYSYKQCGKGD